MKRKVLLGSWYAVVLAAALFADTRMVAPSEAKLWKGATEFSDPAGTVHAGDKLELTGKEEEGFVEVKHGGGTAWISESDLYTSKQEGDLSKTSGAGGTGTAGAEQEGAYVKGFDP